MLKCGDQFVDGPHEFFVWEEAWEDMVVGEEAYCFALANTVCVGSPYAMFQSKMSCSLSFSGMQEKLFLDRRNRTNS